MFREVTIALLATAALGMLAPDVASARGGGGFHGGGGGFHSGFGGGGFHRGGGFGRGGFHTARFSRHGFRFENFHHTGPNAGTRRFAKHMTGKREVVHCLTSDCRLWHSYRD